MWHPWTSEHEAKINEERLISLKVGLFIVILECQDKAKLEADAQ